MARWMIWMLCLSFASITIGRPWTPDDDVISGIPEAGAIRIETTQIGMGHYRIRFSNPDVKMEQVELDKRSWTLVTIDGETRLWQTGKPLLPAVSRVLRIPNTGNVKVSLLRSDFREYSNIDVLPQQDISAYSSEGKFNGKFEYAEELYRSDEWFPGDLYWVGEPGCLRDARIILFGVHPAQYNPATRTLRVYTDLEFEVSPIGGVGQNELSGTRHPVPTFASMYRDIIGAQDLVDEANEAPPGQILAICRPAVATTMQPFADWKTASGRPTQIATVTTTDPSELQTIISNAFSTWDPPLESILLVGDGGSTTSNYELPAPLGLYNYQTDNIYGQLVGTDVLADVWVGRLSATSISEIQLMVNRTLNYERTPTMTDTAWFTRGWGYAGITQNSSSNIFAIRYCLQRMNQRGVVNTLYDQHNGNVNSSLMAERLSPGAVFWAHRPALLGELTVSDLSSIANINKCFVAVNVTCSSGNWYGTTNTAISEGVIRIGAPSAPAGALSGMSTALPGSTPPYNNCIVTGMYYALGQKNARISAQMYFEGKLQIWRNFHGYTSYSDYFIHWNNVMGDLTVPFWTGVPRVLSHDLPETIGLAQNTLPITVLHNETPVPEALVTVWKKNTFGNNETYVRLTTDSSGHALIPLTNSSVGNLYVTVVGNRPGDNLYPIIDTVNVTQTSFDAGIGMVVIDDDSTGGTIGNNDATINPGETVDLSIQLRNRGLNAVTGISGTLVCNDPRVSVVYGRGSWQDLLINTNGTSDSSFRLQIAHGIVDNTIVPLQLTIDTDQGTMSLGLLLTIRSYKILYVTRTTTPATILPGGSAYLTLSIRNIGGQTIISPVQATLESLTPYLTIINNHTTYSNLPIETTVTNQASEWRFQADSHTIPGSQLPLRAIFHTDNRIDTLVFNVTIGVRAASDPTGPDAYGYYAYDNSDAGYSQHPVFGWNEIITNSLGTRLQLNDNGETFDDAVGIELPFTVQYYGLAYDSMSVCSNGWAAFGDHFGMLQNQYANFRNWRLPAVEGPRNMVAVFWDDLVVGSPNGVFVYSDTTAHKFIITWKGRMAFGAQAAEEFQLIIFDPTEYPTPTGDAKLLFQYRNFYNGQGQPMLHGTDVDYGTIGIADFNYTTGLEYTYWNTYSSGSPTIPNGSNVNRAILFTTEHYLADYVQSSDILPESNSLVSAYPNPFNSSTKITIRLSSTMDVDLKLFDVTGRFVQTVVNGKMAAGLHSVTYDGAKLSSGIYFIVMNAGDYSSTRKVILLR